jgi:hypothetical protein
VVTKEHILAEIRRMAEEDGGRAPGRERFVAQTGIGESAWLGRYWARWGDAVKDAGLEPNQMMGRSDDEEALRRYALETQRLGHPPTHAELRLTRRTDKTLPSSGVYERLGPKAVLLARLAKYCDEHPEFADVTPILAPLIEDSESPVPTGQEVKSATDGFVYLLKSGRHYKLGRTNSVGRRTYELAIQLPERSTLIHEISTDDPTGIEVYWHKRFSDRRRNGEWFELTREDVRAFKKRKFM